MSVMSVMSVAHPLSLGVLLFSFSSGLETGKYLGCFKDHHTNRDLTGYHTMFPDDNTPERCINFCFLSGRHCL
jgi:hypothetical protein